MDCGNLFKAPLKVIEIHHIIDLSAMLSFLILKWDVKTGHVGVKASYNCLINIDWNQSMFLKKTPTVDQSQLWSFFQKILNSFGTTGAMGLSVVWMHFMLWGKPADGRLICVFMYLFSIWGEPAGGRWMDINKQTNKQTSKQTSSLCFGESQQTDLLCLLYLSTNKYHK